MLKYYKVITADNKEVYFEADIDMKNLLDEKARYFEMANKRVSGFQSNIGEFVNIWLKDNHIFANIIEVDKFNFEVKK